MRWPHYEHVFFDCDSTLTTVEGIDILAESAGKQWRVEVLTQAAMDGERDLGEVYDKRLKTLKPTHQQIRDIRRAYKQNIVQDAKDSIAVLKVLGHQIYIISGGLLEPVREFGIFLGVPADHIRAVGVSYNELSGKWWVGGEEQYMTFDDGALTVSDGKAEIVEELLTGKRGRSLLVGDGYSDLLAARAVNLFTGFGGVVNRVRVSQEAPLFIQSASIAPLLAVAAGPATLSTLVQTDYKILAEKAFALIASGAITFNDDKYRERFNKAFSAAYEVFHARSDGDPSIDSGGPDVLDDWASHAQLN